MTQEWKGKLREWLKKIANEYGAEVVWMAVESAEKVPADMIALAAVQAECGAPDQDLDLLLAHAEAALKGAQILGGLVEEVAPIPPDEDDAVEDKPKDDIFG